MNKPLNSEKKVIFFAYKGPQSGMADNNIDSIKRAITEYNSHQGGYVAKSWEEYRTTTAISKDVLTAIDKCDVLVADLTYFNHNVLFELGYAIAKGKNILIVLNEHYKLDGSETAGKKYKNFTLRGIRYTPFVNYKNIHEALQNKLFEGDLLNKLSVNVKNIKPRSTDIFYIESKFPTQASLDLSNIIRDFKDEKKLTLISDDSTEVRYQPLKWYLQNLRQAKMTIIHFLGDKVENSFFENAQNSFFAGLACGWGSEVILFAPAKYDPPLDYHDILVQYTSSTDLVSNAIDWLSAKFKDVIPKIDVVLKEHETNLIKLGIGCDIAENESQTLLNYFVYTGSYQAALNYEKTLLVGRKGSGKTAIYIKLSDELPLDFKNYVVKLQPESDELLDEVNLSQLYVSSRRSFFSAVWQLVIFSKLANTVSEKLKNKSLNIGFNDAEKAIIDFVDNNKDLIRLNFFGVVRNLSIRASENAKANPAIMETLFREYLSPLKRILNEYFNSIDEKFYRVVILADNLDKTWDPKNDLSVQVEMILALFEIENKIRHELISDTNSKIEIKQIVFLREDIFNYIKKQSIEPDKLTTMSHEIDWENYPLLLRDLVENRFGHILNLKDKQEIEKRAWREFFNFKEKKHPYDLILEIVTKRPRDLIYFVAKLFESAINNDHNKVDNEDLEYAIINYTEFLNDNLIAETRAEFPEISNILGKLQKYHGERFEYNQFTKILGEFKLDHAKQRKLIETLFDKGYMLGYDEKTNQPFSDIEVLNGKLQEKKLFFFPNKVYLIAHAKYYFIKHKSSSPF